MKPDVDEAYGDLLQGIQEILISERTIQQRVREIGQEISEDYQFLNREGDPLLLVGVLKGVLIFMADLLRRVTIPVEVDFMAVSNYSPESRDQGLVRLVKDLEISITERHILFVEDVIDTGLTLNYLLSNLKARGPASLEVCVLFDKSQRRLIDIPLKYKGFDLPDRFVVGYGLDHREQYRNLPFVALLTPEAFLGSQSE